MPLKGDECERDYITSVARKMMKKYSPSSMAATLKLGNYGAWRDESFAFSTTDVYSADLVRFHMPSEKYKRKAFAISERRLVLAGYRLGATLNEIFSASAAPAGPVR